MKHYSLIVVLAAAVLLLGVNSSLAVENTDVTQDAASKPKASPQRTKRKAAARVKLVDINNATSEELKKLPGIGDAEAARIVAGRPYNSKAWLVTHNIIDRGVYERIKKLINVKKQQMEADRNTATHDKQK